MTSRKPTRATRRSAGQKLTAIIALVAVSLGTSSLAAADPCGMVPPPPPLEIATSATIERIGVQKTYVAFDRGVETMVLRPGFQGNVDEFGMLIPFPSPPELRKVDDNIFSHIAAAIDPPEVIARVQRFRPRSRPSRRSKSAAGASMADSAPAEQGLRFDEVRVVKKEAVGMYEVAVLAAGSPKALKRWMDDNSFRYPEGMDSVVNDYVRSKWFFVAVKTKVGDKSAVNPRPGMRKVNANRTAGTQFKGFVQAMGFRFRTKELVVPMRLSVFNAEGNSRNIVYALTNGPSKINGIPESFVKRQIKGRRLFQNVTNPLPLRVIGGTKADLSSWQQQSLAARRDPAPHNGLAKELFGSDMLAMRRGRLSNPLEVKEKALLNIGESLGLRGRVIDDLNRAQLKKERELLSDRAIERLQGMTLSVIDGAFDRQVLAKQNLRFKRHRMASASNNKAGYDAIRQGPGTNLGGKLYLWQVSSIMPGDVLQTSPRSPATPALLPGVFDERGPQVAYAGLGGGGDTPNWPIGLLLALVAAGLGLARKSSVRPRVMHPVLLACLMLMVSGGIAFAQFAKPPPGDPRQLEGEEGEIVATRLAKAGDKSLPTLLAAAVDRDHPVAQGRAIIALVQIGGEKADAGLAQLIASNNQSMLVRTWAAAGRMQMARSSKEVFALEALSRSFPATRRPWVKSLSSHLQKTNAEDMLETIVRVPELQSEMQAAMSALPAKKLLDTMMSASNQQVRQRAASLLGTKGERAGKLVAQALRFNNAATQTPWKGGPLYLPGIAWTQKDARAVANQLLRWMLWAEKKGDAQSVRIAGNNLMSQALADAAGYKPASGQVGYATEYWLGAWTKTFGSKAVTRLLKDLK